MSKKQTAVDWLIKELRKPQSDKYIVEITKQALQLERKQLEEAFEDGWCQGDFKSIDKSEYYTQTYGECTHKS